MPVPRSDRPLRVATYNVHRCVGRDGRFDPDRVAGVLKELDADVLALQELQWRSSDALHLLDRFAAHLGQRPIPGPTLLRPDGHYGNAVLTRPPVSTIRLVDLPSTASGCGRATVCDECRFMTPNLPAGRRIIYRCLRRSRLERTARLAYSGPFAGAAWPQLRVFLLRVALAYFLCPLQIGSFVRVGGRGRLCRVLHT